jgi:RNA polymerase sigma-70 factor (ECF subfamily)
MSISLISKLFAKDLVYKSDEELMKEFQVDQTLAFNELYHRYKSALYTYFLKLTSPSIAEELLQELFIKVIQKKNSFEFKSTFKTWIWKIAHNTIIDYWRSKNHQIQKITVELDDEINESHFLIDSVEQELLKKVTNKQLQLCINELPEEQQQIVFLHTYSELSHDEISQITGNSVGSIKSTLFRAKEKLTQCFKRGGHL